MSFGRRELPPDTLGEALRIVREEAGLSLEEVAQRSSVQVKYVTAIEAGRYDQTPGLTYVRGFLRSIAEVLDLSPESVISRFEEEPSVQPTRKRSIDESAARTRGVAQPKLTYKNVRFLGIAGFVVIALVIFGFQVAHIVAAPKLVVTQPAADTVVTEPKVTLVGKTDPEVTVQVNGQTVQVDTSGSFTEVIDLQQGLNTLTITANRKSSRTTTVTRRVLVQIPAVVQ